MCVVHTLVDNGHDNRTISRSVLPRLANIDIHASYGVTVVDRFVVRAGIVEIPLFTCQRIVEIGCCKTSCSGRDIACRAWLEGRSINASVELHHIDLCHCGELLCRLVERLLLVEIDDIPTVQSRTACALLRLLAYREYTLDGCGVDAEQDGVELLDIRARNTATARCILECHRSTLAELNEQ